MTLMQQICIAYTELSMLKPYQFIKRKNIKNDLDMYTRQLRSLDVFALADIPMNSLLAMRANDNIAFNLTSKFSYDLDTHTASLYIESSGILVKYIIDHFIVEDGTNIFYVYRNTKLPRYYANIWANLIDTLRYNLIADINTIAQSIASSRSEVVVDGN